MVMPIDQFKGMFKVIVLCNQKGIWRIDLTSSGHEIEDPTMERTIDNHNVSASGISPCGA